MPWVDPLKDVNAIAKKLEIGLTTQTEELAERGMDFEDWCAIKAQEKAIKDRYGLVDEEMTEPQLGPEDFEKDDKPPAELPPAEPEPKRIPRKRKKQMRRSPS